MRELLKIIAGLVLSWGALMGLLYASCESQARSQHRFELFNREREDCTFRNQGNERARVLCVRAVDDRQYRESGGCR